MAVKKTGTGASDAKKVATEGCSFESVDLFLDIKDKDAQKRQNKITVYKKGDLVQYKVLYFLSNSNGKDILIKAIRKDKDKCRDDNNHSQIILFNDFDKKEERKPIKDSGNNAPVKYQNFSIPDHIKYILLPTKSDYAQVENLIFTSCDSKKRYKILVYPEIKYSFEFKGPSGEYSRTNSDFEKYDKGTSNEMEISISVEYDNHKASLNFKSETGTPDLVSAIQNIDSFLKGWDAVDELVKKALNLPVLESRVVEIKVTSAPAIKFNLEWMYITNTEHDKIGKNIKLSLGLNPLIGVEIIFHLIPLAVISASGGVLTPVLEVAKWVENIVKKIDVAEAEAFIDFVIKIGTNVGVEGKYSSQVPEKRSLKVQGGVEITPKLRGGVKAKAKTVCWVVEAEGSMTGEISVLVDIYGQYTFDGNLLLGTTGTLKPFKITFKFQASVQFLKEKPSKKGGGGELVFTFGNEKKLWKIEKPIPFN